MEPKWEWVDTIFGGVAGIIASILSILGWLAPKFAKLESETVLLRNDMNMKVENAHIRITDNLREITKLKAHREDDLRRLEGMDEKLDKILDRLSEPKGRA